MSTCSEPHLACHHTGPEFDWWRCKEGGYVGRPPSPFPASFETARHNRRPDSSDLRYETGATIDHNASTNNGLVSNGAGVDHNPIHNETGCQYVGDGTDAHRLFWPLCQGPDDIGRFLAEDVGQVDDAGGNQKRKKTPRLPYKRPPWIPTKMPNKWGVAGHPPPYTNYCRETLFNTRTADPAKSSLVAEVANMEFVPPGGVCCRRPPEHSRQFFDWWRISGDGMIVQAPPPPAPPLPPRPFPLKKSELCWPLTRGCEAKPPDNECHVDKDFWPDKADRSAKRVTPFNQCQPWRPAKLPNEFGVIKYAPPYTRYCRDREKPLNFVCKA